jgi:hypothetical protein
MMVSIASFHEETLVGYMIHKGHYVCKRYETKARQKLYSQLKPIHSYGRIHHRAYISTGSISSIIDVQLTHILNH